MHLAVVTTKQVAYQLYRSLGFEVYGTEPEFVSELGPVVATHLGPGVLAAGGLPGAALG